MLIFEQVQLLAVSIKVDVSVELVCCGDFIMLVKIGQTPSMMSVLHYC